MTSLRENMPCLLFCVHSKETFWYAWRFFTSLPDKEARILRNSSSKKKKKLFRKGTQWKKPVNQDILQMKAPGGNQWTKMQRWGSRTKRDVSEEGAHWAGREMKCEMRFFSPLSNRSSTGLLRGLFVRTALKWVCFCTLKQGGIPICVTFVLYNFYFLKSLCSS